MTRNKGPLRERPFLLAPWGLYPDSLETSSLKGVCIRHMPLQECHQNLVYPKAIHIHHLKAQSTPLEMVPA